MEISATEIRATPLGRVFLRNLAMPFDAYLPARQRNRCFQRLCSGRAEDLATRGPVLTRRSVANREESLSYPDLAQSVPDRVTVTERAILFLQLGGPETLEDVPSFSLPALLGSGRHPRQARHPAQGDRRFHRPRARRARPGSSTPRSEADRRSAGDREQAAGVEKILRGAGRDVVVRAAMTCSAPLVEDVVADLARSGVRRFLALPLYPQYSLTTTKGALERSRGRGRTVCPRRASSRSSDPGRRTRCFVAAHAETIREGIRSFPDPRPERVHLLYSAHSIPKKLVTREGDPYPTEVEASIAAINTSARREIAVVPRVPVEAGSGRVARSADARTRSRRLGRAGARQVLAIPIAFVSDHVETLYEIDQLFGERRAGRESRNSGGRPG